ncbi:hypothetical protein [Thalassoroseus pseudoceratinae]|uniref:hypothetical protein n=1 Tax=Thalassoroseus pseudoceratinae TaxID=2713176 RepID=UPI00141FCF12|nr:hypothetical protein [Thalassoroseus pseudoceratinae]
MKIFAPAVIGAGLGVFAMAMMVGVIAAFGPPAIPANGLVVQVDTVQTSLYLMLLGWPVAALLGALGGVVVGLIHAEATTVSITKPAAVTSTAPVQWNRTAVASPMNRKPRPSRAGSFNQPA